MRELWPILGFVLTGVLWRASGYEWSVPAGIEQKILRWKREWHYSQIILRVFCQAPLEELEQFAWCLKRDLPRLQRELGMPIRLEIESPALMESTNYMQMDTYMNKDLYISCLYRRFPELYWVKDMKSEVQ